MVLRYAPARIFQCCFALQKHLPVQIPYPSTHCRLLQNLPVYLHLLRQMYSRYINYFFVHGLFVRRSSQHQSSMHQFSISTNRLFFCRIARECYSYSALILRFLFPCCQHVGYAVVDNHQPAKWVILKIRADSLQQSVFARINDG